MALRRILASPEFVFRFERAATTSRPARSIGSATSSSRRGCRSSSGAASPTTSCSSSPSTSSLHEPATLRKQVRRMLDDPRSDAFIENFAGQWLYLRNLKTKGGAVEHFPNFDDNLRQAFRTETEMLFASIVREDRNLLDILTADYTFVNDRLARHYGMAGIYGSEFRRVPVENDARRGVLGHGSILLVTSYARAHFARAARRLGAREHRRRTGADAAAERAGARGAGRHEEPSAHAARADGAAHDAAVLRRLPQDHGSRRLRDGELRRDRPMAHRGARRADRRTRPHRRRHRDRRRRRPAQRTAEVLRSLRADRRPRS